ncbi:hypothetical protein ACUY3D_02720 [Corynebacterium guaraldiae]
MSNIDALLAPEVTGERCQELIADLRHTLHKLAALNEAMNNVQCDKDGKVRDELYPEEKKWINESLGLMGHMTSKVNTLCDFLSFDGYPAKDDDDTD